MSAGTLASGLESALLAHCFGGAVFPQPVSIWAALSTALAGYTNPGTEIAGGGYIRMQAVFTAPAGVPPYVTNTAAIQWAAATADWGLVRSCAVFSASTGGIYMAGGLLVDPADGATPRPVEIKQGDIFRFPINGLLIGFMQQFALPGMAAVAGPAAQTRTFPHIPPPWTARGLRAKAEVVRP